MIIIMRNIIGVFMLLLLASCALTKKVPSYPPRYDYYSYDSYDNADFDYGRIYAIDSVDGGKSSMLDVFTPTKGDYKVVRYISYDYGPTFDDYSDSINFLLVLKLDLEGYVLDGFLCYLQTSDYPFSSFLLRTNKRIKVKDGISVKKLEFDCYRNSISDDCRDIDFLQRRMNLGIIRFQKNAKSR